MIEEAARDPAVGIGKPERLSQNLSGYWSRRISDEHRLVYRLRDEAVIVVQARYHYYDDGHRPVGRLPLVLRWRCRESNPGPPSLHEGFSVRSPLCLYSDPPVTRTSRCDDPSRCLMFPSTPRPG